MERVAEIQSSPVLIPSDTGSSSFFQIEASLDTEILPASPVICIGDSAVLDVNQVAAYYAFVNRLADGLGVELEAIHQAAEEDSVG